MAKKDLNYKQIRENQVYNAFFLFNFINIFLSKQKKPMHTRSTPRMDNSMTLNVPKIDNSMCD